MSSGGWASALMTLEVADIAISDKLVSVFAPPPGEARYRGAYGGRGSGKTRGFALGTAIFGYECARQGRGGVLLCAREFMNSLDESSMEEIKTAIRSVPWLDAFYEIGEKFVRSKCGRIRYVFAGLNRSLNALKSKANILLCWVDEAEHVSETAWRKLIPTVREAGSEIWVTWNPENEGSATDRRFRQATADDMRIVELNWRDNPWFPAELERERAADEVERPDDYAHVWEGGYLVNMEGSYYARHIATLEAEGRFYEFEPSPDLPFCTSWDIGVDDYTAVWVWQEDGVNAYLVDFYEVDGVGPEEVRDQFLAPNGYFRPDTMHYFPHDLKNREWGGGGRSRYETVKALDYKRVTVGAAMPPEERIAAARRLLPLCHIRDTPRVRVGLRHLRRYSRRWNEAMGQWERPLHDEHSHAADAFGGFAVDGPIRPRREPVPEEPPRFPVEPRFAEGGGLMVAAVSVREEIERRAKRAKGRRRLAR